jgi:ketosteroid isomerase-like protein
MSIEDNKQVVIAFFDNVTAGNAAGFLGALADDATWWVPGHMPISGTMSKEDLVAALGRLGPKIDGGMRLTPTAITAEGDRVAVEAESYAKMKSGKIYQNTYHFLFIVRGGKIQSAKEYMDTIHANEVLCS